MADPAGHRRAAAARISMLAALAALVVSWSWPLLSGSNRPWLGRAQVRHIDERPYDVLPDEYRWLTISDLSARCYLEGRWRDPFWLQPYQSFGVTNPVAGKLLLGLPALVAARPPLSFWEYDRAISMDQNLARSDTPDARRLLFGRSVALGSGVLAVVLAAGAVWVAARSVWAAGAFVLLAAFHVVPAATVWRVNIDWPAQLWTWAAMLLILLSPRARTRSALILTCCASLAAGLAIGTKLSAVVVLAPLGVAALLTRTRWRNRLLTALAAIAIATGVYLLVNPAWQMAPGQTARQVALWEQRVAARFAPGHPHHLDAGDKLRMALVSAKPGAPEWTAAAASLAALLLWLARRELRSQRALALLVLYTIAAAAATAVWLPGPIERWLIGSNVAVCALGACLPAMLAHTFRSRRLAAPKPPRYTRQAR